MQYRRQLGSGVGGRSSSAHDRDGLAEGAILTNLAMLLVGLLAGMLLRVTRRLPENAHVAINGFIIHIALPA